MSFFDLKATLCHLFPGIEARLNDDTPAEDLFEKLTPDQMAVAPDTGTGLDALGAEGDASPMSPGVAGAHRKRSTFLGNSGKRGTRNSVASLNRQKSVTGDSLSNTQKTDEEASSQATAEKRAASGLGGTGTRVSLVEAPTLILPDKDGEAEAGGDQVTSARLTAANLQQHTTKKAGGDFGGPGGGAGMDEDETGVQNQGMKSIPDNWQVSVHTYLKKGMSEKIVRQARITRRMEYLRKELENAGV
jgi:hypothetical protein